MPPPDADRFFDCSLWQAMLDQESSFAAGACVGLLRREDYTAHQGILLLLKWEASAMRASLQTYSGTLDTDIAILLVADEVAAMTMQSAGLASLRSLVRRGAVHPYMLKTMTELEAGGLEDFIEDLWLTAPHH